MAKHRGHNEGTIYTRTTNRQDGTPVSKYVAQLPLDAQGKRRQVGSYSTMKEAREALRAAQAQVAAGHQVGRTPTFEVWAIQWLDSRRDVAYATHETYTSVIKHMTPYIGKLALDRLAEEHVRSMWAQLGNGVNPDGTPRHGGALSPTTVANYRRVLRAVLQSAVKSRCVPLSYNVASDAKTPRAERKDINPLSKTEVQALFVATTRDPLHALWVTLITTGMREGEALALRWSDIDQEHSTASVRGSIHRETGNGLVRGETKTRKDRVVTLRPATLDALRKHKIRQNEMRLRAGPFWQDADLIFAAEDGRALNQPRVRRAFARACAVAGIGSHTVKDTRHTFATIALQNGVHPKIVADTLGHSSIAITLNIYSHVIQGLGDQLAHLDSLFAS